MSGRTALLLTVLLGLLAACGEEQSDSPEEPCGGCPEGTECLLGSCVGSDPGDAGDVSDLVDVVDAVEEPDADLEPDADDAVDTVMDRGPDGPPPCEEDDDCPAEEVCGEEGICRPGCRRHADCAADHYCDDDIRECVVGCRSDGNCLDGLVCDRVAHECVPRTCTRDRSCPSGQYCDLDAGHCAMGCRAGGCQPRTWCDIANRTCVPGCSSDSDCDEGLFCEANAHTCLVGCRADRDCEEDWACVHLDREPWHLCLPPSCRRDTQCAAPEYCAENQEYDRMECHTGCRIEPDNCGPHLACLPDDRVCAPALCQEDADCAMDEVCVEEAGVCRVGCRDDEACAQGQTCDPRQLLCSCAEDADCGEGQVCDRRVCARRCDYDEDCPGGETCESELQVCVLGCRDDENEPNNNLNDATWVTLGEVGRLKMCYLEPPAREAMDCFVLDLPFSGRLTAIAAFLHEEGNLDLELYDTALELFGEGNSEDDGETVEVSAWSPGTHWICAVPAGAPFQLWYDLSMTFLQACQDHTDCPQGEACAQELDDLLYCRFGCRVDDECGQERACDPQRHLCTCELRADCPGDLACDAGFCVPSCRDHDECADGEACADGVCRPGCRDDGMCPLGQHCSDDFECADGCTSDARCAEDEICVAMTCVPSCGGDEDCPQDYHCGADLHMCIENCVDDEHEPNNRPDTAPTVLLGDLGRLQICYPGGASDPHRDCFAVEVGEDLTVSIVCLYSLEDGDLNLELFGPGLERLAEATTATDGETLLYPAQEGGLYRVCVVPLEGLPFATEYNLSVRLQE